MLLLIVLFFLTPSALLGILLYAMYRHERHEDRSVLVSNYNESRKRRLLRNAVTTVPIDNGYSHHSLREHQRGRHYRGR